MTDTNGRGVCTACGRCIALMKNGTIRRHAGDLWKKHCPPCAGSGQPPTKTTDKQAGA